MVSVTLSTAAIIANLPSHFCQFATILGPSEARDHGFSWDFRAGSDRPNVGTLIAHVPARAWYSSLAQEDEMRWYKAETDGVVATIASRYCVSVINVDGHYLAIGRTLEDNIMVARLETQGPLQTGTSYDPCGAPAPTKRIVRDQLRRADVRACEAWSGIPDHVRTEVPEPHLIGVARRRLQDTIASSEYAAIAELP